MNVMANNADVKILREARIDDGLLVIADCALGVLKNGCGDHFRGAPHCRKGLVARFQARRRFMLSVSQSLLSPQNNTLMGGRP